VVASEVRSLAQRSAQAAKEIKGLIGESVDKVEAGTHLVAQAGKTMGDVVQQVQRVSDLIGEISAASLEQSSGIGQIGDAVSQLDQVTQQNAALVEESAAAAESLKHQAAALAHTVSVFKIATRVPMATGPAPQVTMAAAVKSKKPATASAAVPVKRQSASPPVVTAATADDGEWASF
jgi:hypothetical protein